MNGNPTIGRFLVAVAIAAAAFLLLYFPDRDDGSGATLGALSVLISVALVSPALAKYRPLPGRLPSERSRMMLRALVVGVGLGIANLLVNYGMASVRSAIYDQMVSR